MRHALSCLGLIAFLFIFAIFAANPLSADEGEIQSAFVDLNGDGFDDNAADADNNTIPDQAEANSEPETAAESAFLEFKPIESISQFDLNSFLSNSELFGKLKSATGAISCCRGGLEAGENFGPGNGIGSGAVTGGCPGGVCH